ncbi:hypothetical protein Ocin01_14469 [Orchesella cincta]|uniref:Uncharacterized protein n=1 Tax=Orchesella cincta TaxID=48709 RepID=A0A1D2MGS5_ORCCI|nr:hypothetical protein Ocin01_14469 [Orchesella cincta]
MTRFFNPLFGYPLRRGAIGIGIIDMTICFSLLVVRLYTLDLYVNRNFLDETIEKLELHKLGNKTHQEKVEEMFKGDLQAVHYFYGMIAIISVETLYLIFEAWLCRLLVRSSKRGDECGLKWWMIMRSTITSLSIFMCGFGIYLSIDRDFLDWTLELITVYRIFELVVINELRKEVIATGPAERF